MKKLLAIATVILMSMTLFSCSKPEEKTKMLYISAIPDQKQSDLNTSMTELCAVLSKKTGLDIQYKEVTDYASVVNGFERNEIQIAWFGGLTGVQARAKVKDAEAIVQRIEDEQFKSVFIASASSNIDSLDKYKGKSFTFGSESSTSGHLMPRYFLTQAGITPEKSFTGEVGYSGSHDKTIQLVENGAYDGGALNVSVWDRYVKEGLVDLKKVKVVEISAPYYDYNFTIQPKQVIDQQYGAGSYDKIKTALLEIEPQKNEKINVFFHSKGFKETSNQNYNSIQEIAKSLNLL